MKNDDNDLIIGVLVIAACILLLVFALAIVAHVGWSVVS